MTRIPGWKCGDCGRATTIAAVDATGKCESCTDSSTSSVDASKRRVLDQLRDRYREARTLIPSRKPYANLESILETMMDSDQTASYWADRTLELLVLWLEDLSVEIDRHFPQEMTGEIGDRELSAYRTRRSMAQGLRDATETFAAAFRHSAGTVPPQLPGPPVAKSNGRRGLRSVASRGIQFRDALSQTERGQASSDRGKKRRSTGFGTYSRSGTQGSGPSPLCVMCEHERTIHTAGTDGAGWCGQERNCDCGGFQEGARSPSLLQALAS